jgi:hypothetical protein
MVALIAEAMAPIRLHEGEPLPHFDYFVLTPNHNRLIRSEWAKVDGRPVLPPIYEKKVDRQKK